MTSSLNICWHWFSGLRTSFRTLPFWVRGQACQLVPAQRGAPQKVGVQTFERCHTFPFHAPPRPGLDPLPPSPGLPQHLASGRRSSFSARRLGRSSSRLRGSQHSCATSGPMGARLQRRRRTAHSRGGDPTRTARRYVPLPTEVASDRK